MLNEQRMSECGREPEQFGYNDLMLNEFAHSSSTFMICLRFMVEIFKGKQKKTQKTSKMTLMLSFGFESQLQSMGALRQLIKTTNKRMKRC